MFVWIAIYIYIYIDDYDVYGGTSMELYDTSIGATKSSDDVYTTMLEMAARAADGGTLAITSGRERKGHDGRVRYSTLVNL